MEIYVTLTCGYGGADTTVRYVGTDKNKAYNVSKSIPDNDYYVWVEIWVDGKRIKEEDI